ncbi:hypothetical protein LCGC14_2354360 [marine sediment metagenome]|uniref:Uncharacterized protein n=1 Tax=marine sediment metagenome TaxID=412755 RepID=A0A0F9C8R0_9ZZZZ
MFLTPPGSLFGYVDVGQTRIRTAPNPGGGGGGGGSSSVPAAFNPASFANVTVDPDSGYNPMAYAANVWNKATRPGASQSYMRPRMYGYGSSYVSYPTGYYVGGPTVGTNGAGSNLMYVGGLVIAAALGMLAGSLWCTSAGDDYWG